MQKKLLLFFILICLNINSQTFTSGMIEQGNGSSSVLSASTVGADGKFYCFFNDGTFAHTSNNVNPVYRLVRWESGTSSWVSVANIDASAIPGEVVTNGWSPSKRDQATANSGIVVELKLEDFKPFAKHGALAGMYFQKDIEQRAWNLAGQTQKVPAQRMVDFSQKKISSEISKTSYVPGTESVELGAVFPNFLTQIMREGFVQFGKSMKGYFTNDAILHAPESRTSSPVRIPRDNYTLEHLQIKGLYPCGEGAGYAGGIISAAIDGEKCAIQAAMSLNQ